MQVLLFIDFWLSWNVWAKVLYYKYNFKTKFPYPVDCKYSSSSRKKNASIKNFINPDFTSSGIASFESRSVRIATFLRIKWFHLPQNDEWQLIAEASASHRDADANANANAD